MLTFIGAGYGIIIAFGAAFAIGVWGAATLLARFRDEVQGSEMVCGHRSHDLLLKKNRPRPASSPTVPAMVLWISFYPSVY